jgi:hypothetical protein
MEEQMSDSSSSVRQNFWAIFVAAIACFLLEAGWYTTLQKPWLEGIGRTEKDLMAAGVNPALQYGTAFVAAAVIAAALSRVIQLTGPQTALRGIKVAAIMWVGFVLTTWATEYVFEARTLKLLGINAGFWLLGMMLMGVIVGAWKKKAKV